MRTEPVAKANELFDKGLAKNKIWEGSDEYAYNCWGFTAYLLGWEDEPYWVGCCTMEDHLDDNTSRIEEPELGCVAVFRDSRGNLTHTALVVELRPNKEDPVLVQKPGEFPLMVCSVTDTYKEHPIYSRVREYRKAFR